MISIEAAINPEDGINAQVTVTGTPNGALTFTICRLPNYAQSGSAIGILTGSSYNVATPFPGLWYVWAVDSDGPSDMVAVWVSLTNDPDLRACGEYLATILSEHEVGINAALAQLAPGTTVKSIVFGRLMTLDAFPIITILKPRKTDAYCGLGFLREVEYSYEIVFGFFHQDEGAQLPIATSIADAIIQILNLPMYSSLLLPTGTPLTGCIASEGEASEVAIDEQIWVAQASVLWAAQGLMQDTGVLT